MGVEFGVLGSIEARLDGRLVELGGTRQRLLLAVLLMDLNREVPTDVLVKRIWGEDQAQRGTFHAYVSRLRKALAAVEGVEIARRPTGYVLVADRALVDLYRFRDLVAQARTADGKRAAELFGQALGLWRGEALAGAGTGWAVTARKRLDQERLAAELDRAEVLLRLGRHAEVLAGLGALAEEHPSDERLAGQVMLASYRCGRTAEALEHYQRTHRVLVQELGIDPGPELRRLHQRILTGDPDLVREKTGVAEGPDPAAAAPAAAAPAAAAPAVSPVPRQLPAAPAVFTGRIRELERLSAVLAGPDGHGADGAGGTVVISAIGGTGGVGKTHLAMHWAHRHVKRFPDGQLYVNLRGFDPSTDPMEPSAAVCGFLEALGVAPSALPAAPDAQTALYRSLVTGRRMLVVLDNARDTGQVVPLLPGSATCTVLVTSRNQLTGLTTTHAAQPLALDVLPEDEAHLLLARHLGEDRLAAEPEAVAALLEHCAGLPLALSITAARATTQPDLPLAYLAEELTDTETRLDALDTGELSVSLRAVFAASHRTLDADTARIFALLGLAPGPDISLHAAASLIGHSTARTRILLRGLETAHLLQQHTPNRYRMHDLVRLYAAEHGNALDTPDRDPALRRLFDFYLHTAHHATLLVEGQPLHPVELDPPAAGCLPQRFPRYKKALAWYEAERPCLLAAQKLAQQLGWHALTWQLPNALEIFQRDYLHDALAMWEIGLAAAEQRADPHPQAVAHCHLGFFHAFTFRHAEALDHLDRGLALSEQIGDRAWQAVAHHCYTVVARTQADPDLRRALHHAERALQLYRSASSTTGEVYALSQAGFFHALLGEHQRARACCEQALTVACAQGAPGPEVYALNGLALVLHHGGQYTEALVCHHQALGAFRDVGSAYWEAMALFQLGDTHRALGQVAEARHVWQRARDLFRSQHHTTRAEGIQRKLDALDCPAGG